MMPRCSDPNILAPWFRRRLPAALLLALLATPPAGAQSGLEALRRGSVALEAGRHDEAARLFERARQSLPQLADFAAFFQAQALMRAKRYDAAAKALEPALSLQTLSAVSGRAAVLGAQAWIELNQPKLALAVLGRVSRDLWPQPEGLLALAKAYEGAGDPLAAAAVWQDLWVRYPASEQAAEAASAMARLESALGGRYPPVMPGALLERAARLMDEGRFKPAREEFERLSGLLAGQERERALNGVAAALLRARETARALDWLRGLQLTFPETEAERQFHLVTCYLRLDRLEEMIAAATSIERIAPRSEWRRRALVAAANRLLVENDSARSMPLYQACADSFPESEDGPQCHWKIVWRQWLSRDPGAPAALQDHLKRFPASEKAGAALYFLARDAERRGEAPAARRYLQEIVHRFPNSYYAVLARQRLGRPELARNGASAPAAESFLAAIQWPVRQRRADFTPDQTTSYRIERGRLLAKAGLERWAEAEIRFGVRQDAKPYPSAMALAEIAASRRDYAQALRYIKATANGYLWLDPAGAPGAFWKQAFPLPFQDAIRRHAAAQKLDPYILAGLIRQESEFDPKAVSSSGAIGLTQIMPPTGRALARRAGVRGYRVSLLKSPETNLKIGAYYLRQQLNQRNGSIEETLAGYNGGPSRVTRWKTWGDFQEPAEFIETIPFTQTREYVQIILRNADVYRRLYSLDAASQPAPKPARKR